MRVQNWIKAINGAHLGAGDLIMLHLRTITLGLVLPLLITACDGIQDQSDQQDSTADTEETTNIITGAASSTTEVVKDPALASEDIASVAYEVLSASSGTDAASLSTGLSLFEGPPHIGEPDAELGLAQNSSNDQTMSEQRDCTADAASLETAVQITRIFERTRTKETGQGPKVDQVVKNVEISRVWTQKDPSGGAIAVPCNAASTHIKVKRPDFQGMHLEAQFKRSFLSTRQFKGSEKTRSHEASGKRSVTWNQVVLHADSAQIDITKDVSFDISKTISRPDKDGNTKKTTLSVVTDGNLNIKETFEQGTGHWLTRSLTGKTITTRDDGGRIEITYDNASYSKDHECKGISGTITGAFYEADSTEASREFVIELGSLEDSGDGNDDGEGEAIHWGDGTSSALVHTDCELAEQAVKAGDIKRVAKGKQKSRTIVRKGKN